MMTRWIFPIAGLVAGLVLGGAIIVGSMTASEARRRAEGRVDPGSAQAEAVYVYVGFVLIPAAGAVGWKLGERLGRGGPNSGSHR
ncbi:MAG: hypothetical protein SFX72_08060 [Isosphaeraceae bacterium]|nr:hypothetical protein [Isosphaeraceae bacterium]